MISNVADSLETQPGDFTFALLKKVSDNETELNDLIKEHLRDWDYSRVSVLDRAIIKIATAEILYFPDIPVEVSINEALEMSKEFCNLKSRRFVNGMLDSIFKRLKREGKIHKDISVKAAELQKRNQGGKGGQT